MGKPYLYAGRDILRIHIFSNGVKTRHR